MHPQAINKYLISPHAILSCSMLGGGRLGKVLACPEYPGRFYGRGKTGPNLHFILRHLWRMLSGNTCTYMHILTRYRQIHSNTCT